MAASRGSDSSWYTHGIDDSGFVDEFRWWEERGNYKELKAVDSLFTGASRVTVDNGPNGIACLNLIAAGDDINTRDGRWIKPISVHLSGHIYPANAGSNGRNLFSIALVWDFRPNGVLPVTTDIFLLTTGTSSVYNMAINPANRDRFKVLHMIRGSVGARSTTAPIYSESPTVFGYDAFIDLSMMDLGTVYSGTGGTIASVSTGGLYLVGYGTQVAASAQFHDSCVRLTYID